MKKIFIMLALFCVTACKDTNIAEQKFVNPLFYETMEPVSPMTWRTKITPSSMVSDNKGTVLEQKCILIENTMEAVTLDCEGAYEKELRTQYRFVPQKRDFAGDLIIYQYDKYPREKRYGSWSVLVIYKK